MNSIWKFEIDPNAGLQQVEMPKGSQIMSVGVKNGVVCIWAAVDTTATDDERLIEVLATGECFSKEIHRSYIGTVKQGAYIWHVFERTEDA